MARTCGYICGMVDFQQFTSGNKCNNVWLCPVTTVMYFTKHKTMLGENKGTVHSQALFNLRSDPRFRHEFVERGLVLQQTRMLLLCFWAPSENRTFPTSFMCTNIYYQWSVPWCKCTKLKAVSVQAYIRLCNYAHDLNFVHIAHKALCWLCVAYRQLFVSTTLQQLHNTSVRV